MNEELLHQLLEKASIDKEFQQALLADPISVLTHWGFTHEEAASLSALIGPDTAPQDLDERLSKSIFGPDFLFGGGGPGG